MREYRIVAWAGDNGTDYVILAREDGESPVSIESHGSKRFAEYRKACLIETDWLASLPWENGMLRQNAFRTAIRERYGIEVPYLQGAGRQNVKIEGFDNLWLSYTWYPYESIVSSAIEVAYVN